MPDILYTSRRQFLGESLRLLSAGVTLPLFVESTAWALPEPQPRRRRKDDESRILVVVQLAGGNDGLNTVIPCEHELYYQHRPRLAVAKKDVLALANGIGLHPAAAGLKSLYDAGHLAIVQGVGYPNPNRSHFVSMDIWHSADPEQRKHSGWLGRYFDAECAGEDPEPLEAVALLKEAPLALQGERFAPLTMESPQDLLWRPGRRDDRALALFRQLNHADSALPPTTQPTQQFLHRAALDALAGADEIRHAAGRALRGGRGGSLGQQLRLVTQMIRADLPTRVYYVSLGGFDTHANQAGRHTQLLREFGEALEDFVGELAKDKLLERVLVLCFSEFGRRVQENASGGTDHGEAAPVFLCGGRVRPGLHEPHPDLARLHRGDLAFACDFRQVYAAVLRQWLDVPPREINTLLGGRFKPLEVLRA